MMQYHQYTVAPRYVVFDERGAVDWKKFYRRKSELVEVLLGMIVAITFFCIAIPLCTPQQAESSGTEAKGKRRAAGGAGPKTGSQNVPRQRGTDDEREPLNVEMGQSPGDGL